MQADFVAIQEANVTKDERADKKQTARSSGCGTAIGACMVFDVEGKSAGVAICGRMHIGMHNSICDEAWPKLLNQRFMLKHVVACCRGGIHIGSYYLTSCSVGAKDKRNLDTFHHMAGVLISLKGPWVVGGDWNCTLEDLEQLVG